MSVNTWVTIIVLVVLEILFIPGLMIALGIIRPKRRPLLESRVLEENKYPGIMDFYRESLTTMYRIRSRYGYEIAVYYLKNSVKSNRYLVMSHGHTYTHHGCLKYARIMMRYGFNIIMYDQRFHGDSGGHNTTLGYYEKDDLHDIVTDTFNRFGSDIELGTYGESMGAATVILEAATDERVKYVFADCGFDNLERLIEEIMARNKKMILAKFLPFGKLVFRIITGVSMTRISPKDALATISVPIFFAHGKSDNFINYKHTEDMYENYLGPKMLFLAGNEAKHAEGYLKDTANYEQSINEFVRTYITKEM